LIGENKELWLELCEQAAAVEQDPEKWQALVQEINRLLEEKESVLDMRENKERWKVLCEQAAGEQDPKKLLELTKEINDLLLGKQHRLDGEAPTDTPKGSDA
jgi:hypothetical protein